MDRETLKNLSVEELFQVGKESGLDVYSLIDREELIDFLVEQMDLEDQGEPEKNKKRKEKYFSIESGSKGIKLREDFPLPEHYSDTRIVLLIRDPDWAFAYWDIDPKEVKSIAEKVDSPQFLLRVYEIEDGMGDSGEREFYFDIPIQITDYSWYINVPNRGSSYIIDLGYTDGENFVGIATSNRIDTPRGTIASEIDKFWHSDWTDNLIDLAGGNTIVREQRSAMIPRRVTSLAVSHYFYSQDKLE